MMCMDLYNNILDNIKEAHIKLGYSSVAMSFNYQMSSLRHLVNSEDVGKALDELRDYALATLGEISYVFKETQVRITVPAAGVMYVAENVAEKPHLRELIDLVKGPGVTLQQIQQVFAKYSDQVICKPTDESGMDYVLWFADGIPDDYRYCICLDGLGATYHRLSKKDFEDIYNQ